MLQWSKAHQRPDISCFKFRMDDSVSQFRLERAHLQSYREKNPELLQPRRPFTYAETLRRIGITVDFGPLPQGYLNLYPQDFIVEEIDQAGGVHPPEPEPAAPPPPRPNASSSLYVDLVKVGLSTIEAVADLAAAANISLNQITSAGIKDKVGIPSQQIAIRGADAAAVAGAQLRGSFLKNFYWGSGTLSKGALQGNRFVIVVRTPTTLGQGWLDRSLAAVRGGFHNFYFFQRFGSPRLISHQLGRLLLQEQYEQVVRALLGEVGIQDVPLLNQLRRQALETFGDWPQVETILSPLRYTFRLELKLVRHLRDHPGDYVGALKTIADQTTLWVYAYASYLFNLDLSERINAAAPVPAQLPLLLNPNHRTVETYDRSLRRDGIADIRVPLKRLFQHAPIYAKNVCVTTAPVTIQRAKILDRGVAIAFQLPGGAYATTFLAHLFTLYQGLPLPAWLDERRHDSKALLGLGSVAVAESILGPYIYSHAADSQQ